MAKNLRHHLPRGFPLNAIIKAMTLIMINNICEWGDMYFAQFLGTMIGTSSTCILAIIYYAVHKNSDLIVTFQNNLLIYKRFIDKIFGNWILANAPYNSHDFETFKTTTNNIGILECEW